MKSQHFLNFAGKVVLTHTVTYLIAGTAAYNLLTRQFYIGSDPIFDAFMRTPDVTQEWTHVMKWFLPAQVLRGLLIAAVLYPFFDKLLMWDFRKRFFAISGLYIVLGFWAATVAAPGTIEGLVYMKPTITPYIHLIVQPEIVVQGLAFGSWLAWWMVQKQLVHRAKD